MHTIILSFIVLTNVSRQADGLLGRRIKTIDMTFILSITKERRVPGSLEPDLRKADTTVDRQTWLLGCLVWHALRYLFNGSTPRRKRIKTFPQSTTCPWFSGSQRTWQTARWSRERTCWLHVWTVHTLLETQAYRSTSRISAVAYFGQCHKCDHLQYYQVFTSSDMTFANFAPLANSLLLS